MDKTSLYYFLLPFLISIKDVLSMNMSTTFQVEHKITDGEQTFIEPYPYNALLRLYDGRQFTRCGGSIISNNVILTAAHCLMGIESVKIRIGSPFDYMGGRLYQSTTFQKHPLFNPRNEDFDVGLIRVEEGMRLDGITARAVELARMGNDPQEGINIDITGWGLINEEDTEYPDTLYHATTRVVERQDCSELLGEYISMNMFCAGITDDGELHRAGPYPDPCRGDFGGPAVDMGSGRQVGIASFNLDCGEINSPTVFTRIGAMPIRMYIMAMAGV